MGCCASSIPEENNTNKKQSSLQKKHQFSCISKSPPRPEEESVKEVLSETPKIKPDSDPGFKVSMFDEKPTKCKLLVTPKNPLLEPKLPSMEQKLMLEEEISQVKSEMCSLSEAISNTTLDEYQTTSGEVHQSVYRSQGHNSNLLKNNCNSSDHNAQLKIHGRSPVRRADPSPPRRYSGPGLGRVGLMRDVVGENSARRSRSPATRSNVGGSPSAKRAGPSPGLVRMVHGPDETRNVDENGSEWAGPKESVENPLVSLECFIFL